MSVSIVIPVYNTADYLGKCVESVLDQTISDFEIIMVDDGSTDNSLAVCREYAKQDSRITVLGQENSGPGKARNAGLNIAKKEYVGFIDSDDWIEPQMYEELYRQVKTEDADIGICGMYAVKNDGTKKIRRNEEKVPPLFDNRSFIRYAFEREKHHAITAWVWNKVFRKSYIDRYHICNNEQLRLGEDVQFMVDCMTHPCKVCFIDEPLYNHIERNESLSRKYSRRTYEDRIKAYEYSIDQLERANMKEETIIWLKVFHCYHASNYVEKALNNNDFEGIQRAVMFLNRYIKEYCVVNKDKPDRIMRVKELSEGKMP